jgi:hypothetical protein
MEDKFINAGIGLKLTSSQLQASIKPDYAVFRTE